jgi:PAS domain S-box-containing protein
MSDATIGPPPRPDDDRIDVLLVDDNEEWAELARNRIERATDDIAVTVVESANEAMVTLQDVADIDCLVVDYMMPRVTGLQLLERVREEHPQLPYLLITSEGSEDVAAQAIDAGVTDYIVKDPSRDQTPLFVSRIRSAVEQYRLRQLLEESETRYRTVIEQSRDALVILEQGQVVFANRRLAEITGREPESLSGTALVEEAVHPTDRERVREILDDWYGDRARRALHEARIVQPDGTIRQCECIGKRITYEGDWAVLVSLRDVTERKRRERELQWERELTQTVQEALVESRTRDAVEQAVTEQLCQYGYSLAWVGEQHGTELVPRVAEGKEIYVDDIDYSLDAGDAESEPSRWAARTGEPQFVSDFTELFGADWREAALDAGFRGGAAFPLVYNDVTYGFLAVYHEQPDRFDETERQLLTKLAETVAFALHSLETEQVLTADRTVSAKLQLADDRYYLVDLARDGVFLDCDVVRVRGTVPHEDGSCIQYLTVDGHAAASVRKSLQSHPDVAAVVKIAAGDRGRFQVHVTGPVPELSLASQAVVAYSTTIGVDGATITVELPDRKSINSTTEELAETFESVSALAVTETDENRSGRPPVGLDIADLTDKQAQALQAAYYHGYFEQPRGNTATAIADSLGVSHATFLQHLHRAQQKVFQQLLSDRS